jgi:hypothetical protein
MVAISGPRTTTDNLGAIGALTAAFSLALGLLILFVLPGRGCSFVDAFMLLILGFLVFIGTGVFLFGRIKKLVIGKTPRHPEF